MTLVVAAIGSETIWLLADRRLSYPDRSSKDDGRKIMFLRATDGIAILGYAGLGATAFGTEPSDWMSAVLRGRRGSLESLLGVLARALETEMQPHLNAMPLGRRAVHGIVAPALVGGEPRLYSIDLELSSDRKRYRLRYRRHADKFQRQGLRPPPLAIGGSGAPHLLRDRVKTRNLVHAVRAFDRKRISTNAVAGWLAKINNDVHSIDETVGPRCIVAWRHRDGGGGHQYYTCMNRDSSTLSLPNIANGMDIHGIITVSKPYLDKDLEAMLAGKLNEPLDADSINAALARLPHEPDEKLR